TSPCGIRNPPEMAMLTVGDIAPLPSISQDGWARYMGHDQHTVTRFDLGAAPREEDDQLAQEPPIALEYNGLAHAALLATPLDLEDVAVGFSFTEGIVRDASDIRD